jgi:hypothetical protein
MCCDRNVVTDASHIAGSQQTVAGVPEEQPVSSPPVPEDTPLPAQSARLPKVTSAAAPAGTPAAPASFLEFTKWQEKAEAVSTQPPAASSPSPPASAQVCSFHPCQSNMHDPIIMCSATQEARGPFRVYEASNLPGACLLHENHSAWGVDSAS